MTSPAKKSGGKPSKAKKSGKPSKSGKKAKKSSPKKHKKVPVHKDSAPTETEHTHEETKR